MDSIKLPNGVNLEIPGRAGEVSDGYHTFDELYDHRCLLFIALMRAHPERSFVAEKHHDGTFWKGWSLAGLYLPTGEWITYHIPDRLLELTTKTKIPHFDVSPHPYDGHTPADVLDRLIRWFLDDDDRSRQ